MSQDLSFIKEELVDCEEVGSPFDIDIQSHVKYITLKNRQEYFYTGGKYIGMSDNKIIIQTDKNKLFIPLTIKKPDGTVLYRTRLFVVNKTNTSEDKHNESIIQTQQSIIETMTQKLAESSKLIQEYKIKEMKYRKIIRELQSQR